MVTQYYAAMRLRQLLCGINEAQSVLLGQRVKARYERMRVFGFPNASSSLGVSCKHVVASILSIGILLFDDLNKIGAAAFPLGPWGLRVSVKR